MSYLRSSQLMTDAERLGRHFRLRPLEAFTMDMTRALRVAAAVSLLTTLLAGVGCVIIGDARYVEREERRFSTTGKPEVALSTFDGAIEVRAWDRPEVLVVVEKRAVNKEAAASIDVHTEQAGNRLVVDVRTPKDVGFGFHGNNSRSAKLIVTVPTSADVAAKSGDGSIDVERVAGKLELRSADGSIHGRELTGDVRAHTGDGSIHLEAVTGKLDLDTGDGSIFAAGRFSAVRARSGDGSVRIHADAGSAASEDWDVTTGDGSVTLEVPEGFSGELDVHTGDGRINVDGLTISGLSDRIGAEDLRGRLGNGGSAVRLRSGDGSIVLRRS